MENATPPAFNQPRETLDPTVQSILNDNELFIQHGINYSRYISLKPIDNMELVQNSKLVSFYFKDKNCFINTRRVFLQIKFICTDENDNALTQDDNVSANNVMSHSIIDSCILNIGNFL